MKLSLVVAPLALILCLPSSEQQCSAFLPNAAVSLGTQRYSASSDDYTDELFSKFDTTNSGTINKEEFRAVAKKMKKENSRREVISVATAMASSIFVVTQSNTFQFGQKKLRTNYLEEDAELAQKRLFPTAILSGDLDKAVFKTLGTRGFTPENTLFGHSVCSDEINNRKEQLIPLMINRWQEGFSLGGLGGLPFAGKSGFGAYLHHVPDNGKLLIMFAPHVGIDFEEGRGGDGHTKY